MDLKSTFRKQGGTSLLKQYLQHGLFFTALGEFLILGKSHTALEILRLSTQLKAKQKLEKKYKNSLLDFASNYDNSLLHESSDKVWVCWFQGMDNAPEIVQKCFSSLKENMPNKNIILITKNNMTKYVHFPDFILKKWEEGNISDAHFSDLLRLELLIRYGGMWIDATVYCSSPDIPEYFFNSELFMFQCLKPGRDGHSHLASNWLISAKTNNRVLMAVRHLIYKYWETHNSLIDYFLFHDFMSMALEYFEEDWKSIVPRDNATPHILLLRLFDPYDGEIWQDIKRQTPFHKLSYKFEDKQILLEGTFYEEIIEEK